MPLKGKETESGRSRGKWPLIVVTAAIGFIWLGQGLGVIGGSFMTGEPAWAIVGAGLIVGAAVLTVKRRS